MEPCSALLLLVKQEDIEKASSEREGVEGEGGPERGKRSLTPASCVLFPRATSRGGRSIKWHEEKAEGDRVHALLLYDLVPHPIWRLLSSDREK